MVTCLAAASCGLRLNETRYPTPADSARWGITPLSFPWARVPHTDHIDRLDTGSDMIIGQDINTEEIENEITHRCVTMTSIRTLAGLP